MEYGHGGDIYSRSISMDFSANLNPLGLPKGVKDALKKGILRCQVYPDSRCAALIEALASHYQMPQKWVLAGNGAADLIFNLAFGLGPKRAVLLAPTFSEYGSALLAAGCEIRYYDLKKEEKFSLNEKDFCCFLEQEGSKTDLVFLCNPNNPTGLFLDGQAVKRIAETCKKKQMVLAVDECFCDFLPEPKKATILPYLAEFPNVIVLKAFTKTYAMAGLRLGYCFCSNEKILHKMEQVRQPWSVSALAQEAGIWALKETDYVEQARKILSSERDFLKKVLTELGFEVWESQANYLFFYDKNHEENWLYEKLLETGVLIRSCGNYRGLNGRYYRICIKTREENEKLIRRLEEQLWQKQS